MRESIGQIFSICIVGFLGISSCSSGEFVSGEFSSQPIVTNISKLDVSISCGSIALPSGFREIILPDNFSSQKSENRYWGAIGDSESSLAIIDREKGCYSVIASKESIAISESPKTLTGMLGESDLVVDIESRMEDFYQNCHAKEVKIETPSKRSTSSLVFEERSRCGAEWDRAFLLFVVRSDSHFNRLAVVDGDVYIWEVEL